MDLLLHLIFFITYKYYEIIKLEMREMLKEIVLLIAFIFIKFSNLI
jgi:hypothetical protein